MCIRSSFQSLAEFEFVNLIAVCRFLIQLIGLVLCLLQQIFLKRLVLERVQDGSFDILIIGPR